jgi:hypothetical protein
MKQGQPVQVDRGKWPVYSFPPKNPSVLARGRVLLTESLCFCSNSAANDGSVMPRYRDG